MPQDDEVISFIDFHRLGLPAHPFMQGLLYFYGHPPHCDLHYALRGLPRDRAPLCVVDMGVPGGPVIPWQCLPHDGRCPDQGMA